MADDANQAPSFTDTFFPRQEPHVFAKELDVCEDPDTPTRIVDLDWSNSLQIPYPATTPTMLARYIVLRPGEALDARFAGSGAFFYVIAGEGRTTWSDRTVEWRPGDAFTLLGGTSATHRSLGGRCWLYVVSDEPLYAFLGAASPGAPQPAVASLNLYGDRGHYVFVAASEMRKDTESGGRLFDPVRNAGLLRTLLFSMNWQPVETDFTAHRHTAAAIQLLLDGEASHSMVEGRRFTWRRHAVMVTPPGLAHSHHGSAHRLTTQDAILHLYARTYFYIDGDAAAFMDNPSDPEASL